MLITHGDAQGKHQVLGPKSMGNNNQFKNLDRFRVDNVHQETYKILGGLHRHGLQGEFAVELIIGEDKQESRDGQRGDDNNDQDYDDGGDNQPGSDKKKKLVFTDKQGEKTLDKLENINIDHFDTEAMIDPLFKQTTAKFDEMGLGSLMSSKLNVNSDLLIQLDS